MVSGGSESGRRPRARRAEGSEDFDPIFARGIATRLDPPGGVPLGKGAAARRVSCEHVVCRSVGVRKGDYKKKKDPFGA